MSWTDPLETAFETNDIFTEGNFRTYILDNLTILGAGARVTNSAVQSITTATWTSVGFDTERWDPDGFHSNVTNNSRLTVPSGLAGRYLMVASYELASDNQGGQQCRIRLNGSTIIGAGDKGVAVPATIVAVYRLAAGDYVELQVFQADGVSRNVAVSAEFSPEFTIQGLGGAAS